MMWIALALIGLFVALCRISVRRHARDPRVMPYRTGHVGGLGEAPVTIHHRLGSHRP